MAVTEEGCAEATKAGNLSASFPDAPHGCKDVFWPYKCESKTKSAAIALVTVPCCSVSNGPAECCDHTDYEALCQWPNTPRILQHPPKYYRRLPMCLAWGASTRTCQTFTGAISGKVHTAGGYCQQRGSAVV